ASLGAADVVVANLTGALIQRHASGVRSLVAPGGVLIVSGFTVEEQEGVSRAIDAGRYETAQEGEWVAMLGSEIP
ncbi:MAG: 50S ribosomal protein L11 methyltransferase, partial [Acidobacteria bacterium]|nr:50S ribosomal protein L11 methyltransferase [Acidobacteriota bacterium]